MEGKRRFHPKSQQPRRQGSLATRITAMSCFLKNTRGCYSKICYSWKGKNDFLKAQCHVCIILVIALVGNNWPNSYPRNDNHDPKMFWAMNGALLVAALLTLKHEPSDRITMLSRHQTEEWKGWMQWAFILYHYYRAYFAYNEIRVFVSAYVWMTGFGNFLYFDKKRDYSWERLLSMWLRINYFPLLLCLVVGVPLELFYIVPLHTVAFFCKLKQSGRQLLSDDLWLSTSNLT